MTLNFDPIAEARRQWREHRFGEEAAMGAVTSVFRAQQILLARIDEALKPMDLTFSRYEVLTILQVSSRGTLPLNVIGERLQVSPASVTNAINRLEDSGDVTRESHPTDGRTTLAAITEAGRAKSIEATAVLADIRFGANGIDDDAAEEVIRLLGGLRLDAKDVQVGRLGRHAVDPEVEAEARARRGQGRGEGG